MPISNQQLKGFLMKKFLFFLFISINFFLLSGCVSLSNPFKSNTFVVKEGYLLLSKINENIAKQMPLDEKIGSNEIKIVKASVFAGPSKNRLTVEAEFIFKSFEIPEGLPAIARFSASLKYNPKTKEFKLTDIRDGEIKFLKEELVEFINKRQRKFIPDTLKIKLQELVLHKSKKRLKIIKSFEVKEGKIKIKFNN